MKLLMLCLSVGLQISLVAISPACFGGESTDQSASLPFSPPQAITEIRPKQNAGRVTGWVIVDMTVDIKGNTTDQKIIFSTGNEKLEKIAIDYASNMKWVPAKLNGFPIESHAQRKIQYSYYDPQPVRSVVVQSFKTVDSAIEKGNEDDARAALNRIQLLENKSSSESIANYLAEYKIERKWGSLLNAYSAIRAAESGGEKAFLDFSRDMYFYFMVELFRTQVSLGRLGEALITGRKIEKSAISAKIKDSVLKVVNSILREQFGNSTIELRLLTNSLGYEHVALLKSNKFSIKNGAENINEMRLTCNKKSSALVVQQDWMYEIHEPVGDCALFLLGRGRSEITIVEN